MVKLDLVNLVAKSTNKVSGRKFLILPDSKRVSEIVTAASMKARNLSSDGGCKNK